jgi:hypothetical protein
MRTSEQDADVTRLLRVYDRTVAALEDLEIDVAGVRPQDGLSAEDREIVIEALGNYADRYEPREPILAVLDKFIARRGAA